MMPLAHAVLRPEICRAMLRRLMSRAVLGLVLASASVHATPILNYEGAVAAFRRGEFAEALADFRALAEFGDQRSQVVLGQALVEGQHLPRDLVEAYAWFGIASQDGRSDPQTAARAMESKLALEPALSGRDLIRAEQLVAAHLAAEPATAASRWAADLALLYPASNQPTQLSMAGCAADRSRWACRDAPEPDGDSCSRVIPNPDFAASEIGLDAAIETPPPPSRPHGVLRWARVMFVAHIDRTGYVCRVVVREGSRSTELDAAALATVSRWRLQPALRDGKPVEAIYHGSIAYKWHNLPTR